MSDRAKLVRPRDAAKVLGISYSTLKRWIHTRKLQTVQTQGGAPSDSGERTGQTPVRCGKESASSPAARGVPSNQCTQPANRPYC